MKPNIKKPRNFINPLLSRKSIHQGLFDNFKQSLEEYKNALQAQIASKQSEPNIVTNVLKPFFDALGYASNAHSQSGQSGIDLAIIKSNKPVVIVEAKATNSNDMITSLDINKKAFHESILYFMRERENGNDELFHIIITDFYDWFVFDAKDFDRLFWRNPAIKKIYTTYTNTSLLSDTTGEVYKALALELPKQTKDLFESELIDCAHFNLKQNSTEKELLALYKLLSPDCLLKEFNPNDANSLNREFYSELLYILGLEETKEGGKKIIGKAKESQNGTFYENISNKLGQYQKTNDFESVIKLVIIWINRILFLKLLESQIVKWTDSSKNKFLHPSQLNQYDQLETLFFDVLAKPVADRSSPEFNHIPYLNSSLFEIHQDEKKGITVANLSDDLKISYYDKTVVKDANGKRKTGNASTLPYLLEFLDSFDFANDSHDEITTDTKSLINASVLGLIFEKINGYKDGSFYTPSFITMYMARETVEKAILDKFNQAKKWHCHTLTDLHNKITDIPEANRIIDSIKICDPAVGSGHFLVSALNEILHIKSTLGVLVDESGRRIKEYNTSIENDDLIIKSDEGEQFEYKKTSTEKTRIQKTIFKEKQKIIENCLFGVDINPNSVNICRLRLWIELLKSSYYKPNGELDTLPNIDINIKCGNSLISRFGLIDELKSKSNKTEIKEYKVKVNEYKENIGSKKDVIKAIEAIKVKFQTILNNGHIAAKEFNDKLSEYVKQFGLDGLNKELGYKAFELKLKPQYEMFAKEIDETAKAKQIDAIEKALLVAKEIESGKIYENAFEWRFEFPEVLDDDGEFSGFDVVIGNPPYIDSEAMTNNQEAERVFISENYELAKGNWDIYIAFFERSISISNNYGMVAMITPDKWLTKPFGQTLRDQHSSKITKIVKAGRDVFDSATVDSLITIIDKKHTGQLHAYVIESNKIEAKSSALISANTNFSFDALFSDHNDLIRKISSHTGTLSNFATCENACSTSDTYKLKEFLIDSNDAFNSANQLKVVNTGTISKYVSRYGLASMTYLKDKYLHPIVEKDKFLSAFGNSYGKKSVEPKIIGKGLTLLDWFLDETGEFIPGKSTLIIMNSNSDVLKLLLGILNSKLMIFFIKNKYSSASYNGGISFTKDMINNFPVPTINKADQLKYIEKVDAIINAKLNNSETIKLQYELDEMIYTLYDLGEDEIKIINEAS